MTVCPAPPAAPDISILAGRRADDPDRPYLVVPATTADHLAAHRALRRAVFVDRQRLFARSDLDELDTDDRTVVLVAVDASGTVVGGVRLAPVGPVDLGWWSGSRLVVAPSVRGAGVGPALIRAAIAHVEARGALRFDATVNARHRALFRRLGWTDHGDYDVAGIAHVRMRWPVDRIQRTVVAAKAFLGELLAPLRVDPGGLGPAGFLGDDGAPVPGTDVVAACDAILPSMVDRDPEWAGWCSVLVNLNDLAAMGADPVGMLDAVGAPTGSRLTRIVRGLARGAAAWGVPVLGGHTQVGVPTSLSVTALGRTTDPIRAGGGRVGDELRLTADLTGSWRPGYRGSQWDSTSRRCGADLRAMNGLTARLVPTAAKDVSMAGILGTVGMLAEASGVGATVDVADVCRPAAADMGAWLTCFPGFAMLTTHSPSANGSAAELPGAPTGVRSAVCGRLRPGAGVTLRWPDGVETTAVADTVTALGRA